MIQQVSEIRTRKDRENIGKVYNNEEHFAINNAWSNVISREGPFSKS